LEIANPTRQGKKESQAAKPLGILSFRQQLIIHVGVQRISVARPRKSRLNGPYIAAISQVSVFQVLFRNARPPVETFLGKFPEG
jgi:hypothetical protein